MLSDPAAAAWAAAGRPAVQAPPPVPGRCARCGADGLTVTSTRIVSERFTGFESWPYGSRRLCVPCAWAYSRPPKTQLAMLITSTTVTEYRDGSALAATLSTGPLPDTHAAVLPTALRRHVLATAEWGHLAIDGLVVPWDSMAAHRLAELIWLRTDLGATWSQLRDGAPPSRLLTRHPAADWSRILAAWSQLRPWRMAPPLWDAARILSGPRLPTRRSPNIPVEDP